MYQKQHIPIKYMAHTENKRGKRSRTGKETEDIEQEEL